MEKPEGTDMPREMMSTKELAEYLGIHEKQVYALIKAKKIPCTRVTGKWLFTRRLIDQWINDESIAGLVPGRGRAPAGVVLASGSNDPVLDILLNAMKHDTPGFHIFTSSTGSTEGLDLLSRGVTDIAWCHLFDPKSGEYNIPYITSFFSGKRVTVVHLFYRELGIVSRKGGEGIRGVRDLAAPGIRMINRQKGSGTRLILDHLLKDKGIDPGEIRGYDTEVYTHFEVGLAVLSGKADAGLATVAVSNLLGLPFVPLVKESFDMVLPQAIFFQAGIQRFMEALQSADFRDMVKPLGNYDFNEAGRIIYSN